MWHIESSNVWKRDAALNWEEEYTAFLTSIGFRRGRGSACIFYHKDRKIRIVVHGYDFTILAYAGQFKLVQRKNFREV